LRHDGNGRDEAVSPRTDRQELIESLSTFRDYVSTCNTDFTAGLPTAFKLI